MKRDRNSSLTQRKETPQPAAAGVGQAAWPYYAEDELAAAQAVLASGCVNYWTGQEARLFEQEYAAYVGARRAIALMNGTVALELPLRLWGIGPGDDVIVTPRSFIASASCVVLAGARPIFADVDLDSGNITAESIARVLTPRSRAIIPVHLAGWPCDMDAIMALAKERGLRVLEDCAQAHGARWRGRAVGALGDAAAFSFCQDKIITTAGEGGLLVVNDEESWASAWSFKDHGKTWEAVYERAHGPGFRWVHDRFGTNWRITEVQAAIGRRQLAKLDQWVEKRRRFAAMYDSRLGELRALRVPRVPPDAEHARYKHYVYVRPEALKADWSRDRLLSEINAKGAPCFAGSCSEIYLERAFTGTEFVPAERLPNARQLGATSLTFLVHPTLAEDQVQRVCDAVVEVVTAATR